MLRGGFAKTTIQHCQVKSQLVKSGALYKMTVDNFAQIERFVDFNIRLIKDFTKETFIHSSINSKC
jgi:hypothetical protein